MSREDHLPHAAGGERFATTRWSLVLQAAGGRDEGRSADTERTLAELCQSYWYPLYAFLRRQGYDSHAAADLTQGFFEHLLARGVLAAADPERGRFRSFLIGSLQNYAANERRRERAQKRGEGKLVSLDFQQGEERYLREPADTLTPQRLFDRGWALAVIELAMSKLEAEFALAGKEALFRELKGFINGDDDRSQQEAADRLGMNVGAIKVAVHRLRKRCRELLREEVAGTVASPEEVDDELQRLMAALAG